MLDENDVTVVHFFETFFWVFEQREYSQGARKQTEHIRWLCRSTLFDREGVILVDLFLCFDNGEYLWGAQQTAFEPESFQRWFLLWKLQSSYNILEHVEIGEKNDIDRLFFVFSFCWLTLFHRRLHGGLEWFRDNTMRGWRGKPKGFLVTLCGDRIRKNNFILSVLGVYLKRN